MKSYIAGICGIIAPMLIIVAMMLNIKFVLSRRKARRLSHAETIR